LIFEGWIPHDEFLGLGMTTALELERGTVRGQGARSIVAADIEHTNAAAASLI
jgi:hypothetical protein